MSFQRFYIHFLYVSLSGGTLLLSDVTTVQLSNGTVHIFHRILLLFMKIHLPSNFILRYVRAKMIVHAFMIELDQPDYRYPIIIIIFIFIFKQNFENLCTK